MNATDLDADARSVRTSIWWPPGLLGRAQAEAERRGLSLAAWLRMVVADALRREE